MKKRFGLVILAVLLALACALTFVACGGGSESSGGGRNSAHDGTYYQYVGGSLETDNSVTISRGKISNATSEEYTEMAEAGITVSHSGSVSGNSIEWIVTMSGKEDGVSMKMVNTLSGEINNGVIHFTSSSSKLTAGGIPVPEDTDSCDIYYCMEGRTPSDIEGGSGKPDDSGNGQSSAGSSRENAITAEVDTDYHVDTYSTNGDSWWYSFTPTETQTYLIESRDYSGDPKIHLFWGNESQEDDDGGENYNFRIARELTEGTTYYLEVYGGTFTFSIQVVAAAPSRDNAVVASLNTDYNVDTYSTNGDNWWYSFTPTETQIYVIESKNYTGDPRLYLHWGDNSQYNDDGGDNLNFYLAQELTAGTTYYLEVYGGTFTFSIRTLNMTRADATPITLSETNTANVRTSFVVANQQVWYSITPATAGTYRFYSASTRNSFGIYRGQEQTPIVAKVGSDLSSLDLRCELTAGATYYICLTAANNGTWNINIELCDGAERSKALVAALDTEYNVNIANGGDEAWYVFRPTVRGRYFIQSSDSTNDPYCELYMTDDSYAMATDDNSAGGNDFRVVSVLEANTNYYILASMVSPTGVGSYKLTITPADGATVDTAILAQADVDYTVAPSLNNPVWFEFVAPTNGEYVLRSSGSVGDPACELYNNAVTSGNVISSDDNSGSGNNFFMTCNLSYGSTYYLKVMQLSAMQGNFTVKITSPAGTTRANPINVVLGTEYYKTVYNRNIDTWFAYTPTVSGAYVMRTIGNTGGNPAGELYENDDPVRLVYDDHGGTEFNFLIRRELTAGVTYYIRVSDATSYTFVWSLVDGSERELALNAALNTPYEVRINNSDQEMWYTFIPTSNGNYSLSSNAVGSCDPTCNLYEGTNQNSWYTDDNSGDGNNFLLLRSLSSDSIYYIRLKVVDGAVGNFTFTIRKLDGTSRESALLLNTSESSRVSVSNRNQSVWYSFTPQISGKYTFESLDGADYDPNVTLYQGNGATSLATNDNISSDDKNFRLQYTLTAGTIYYLEVKVGSFTSSGSFGIQVVNLPGSSRDNSLVVTFGTESTVKVDSTSTVVWYSFTPTETREYTIYSTDNTYNCDPYVTIYQGDESDPLASDNDSGDNKNFLLARTLTADTTYYIAASVTRSSNNGTYKVVIEGGVGTSRRNPLNVDFGETYQVNIAANQKVWYKFVPLSTAKYNLTTSAPSTGMSAVCMVYTGTSSNATTYLSTNGLGTFDHAISMTAGTEYYFSMSNSDLTLSGSYSFSVTSASGATREAAISAVLDTEYSISITSDINSNWFKFTPSVDGLYRIESFNRGSCDPHGYLYSGQNTSSLSDDDDGGTDSRNFRITYSLTAGTTYYIQAKLHSSGTGSFTMTITQL